MAGKRKYIFAQESFYLQGILDNINEQDTSFLDCIIILNSKLWQQEKYLLDGNNPFKIPHT